MNREEAHIKLDENDNKRIGKHRIIDEIYDDFESRTCGNCRFWSNEYGCIKLNIDLGTDFGCNEFKIKG